MAIENFENLFQKENKENPIPPQELWGKEDGSRLSPLALRDFGKFLMGRPEHRKGEMVCLQVDNEAPLEVTFFTDDPKSKDEVYQIRQDFKKSAFEVIKPNDREDKITPLLEEFGLKQITEKKGGN